MRKPNGVTKSLKTTLLYSLFLISKTILSEKTPKQLIIQFVYNLTYMVVYLTSKFVSKQYMVNYLELYVIFNLN